MTAPPVLLRELLLSDGPGRDVGTGVALQSADHRECVPGVTPTLVSPRHAARDATVCPTCRGLGWLNPGVDDPADHRFGRLERCPDCEAEQREMQERRAMAILRERVERYTAMTAPLRDCTFEAFDTAADRAAVPAYNAAIRWARGEPPWVYIYGPPGCGKTHLAAAAVNYLQTLDHAVLFATAPSLLAMIRSGFGDNRSERLIGLCESVPWLVVDDLGAERLTDWAIEVWFRIFNTRYTAQARTLVASNVEPARLGQPRLASRFGDVALCRVVPNDAADYRPRRGS